MATGKLEQQNANIKTLEERVKELTKMCNSYKIMIEKDFKLPLMTKDLKTLLAQKKMLDSLDL